MKLRMTVCRRSPTVLFALVVVIAGACSAAAPASTFSQEPEGWELMPSPVPVGFPLAQLLGSPAEPPPAEVATGETFEDPDGVRVTVLKTMRRDDDVTDDSWCLAALIEQLIPAPPSDPREDAPELNRRRLEMTDETRFDYEYEFSCQGNVLPPSLDIPAEELPTGYAEGARFWIVFEVFDASRHLWILRNDSLSPVFVVQVK